MPYAIVALALVGTAVQIWGTLQQGEAAEQAGRAESKQIQNQATAIRLIAERNAERLKNEATAREDSMRLAMRRELSKHGPAVASAGVLIEEGSPLLIEAENAGLADVEVRLAGFALRGQAESEVEQADIQGQLLGYSAALARWRGQVAKSQAQMKAIQQGISGVGGAGLTGYQLGLWGGGGQTLATSRRIEPMG